MIHCDAATGLGAWRAQMPLADRWRLVVPDRPGYGRSPSPRVDFEAESGCYIPLLGSGAHVVGHSYGGVAAMYLAAAAPGLIRSLTLVEPPAFGISDSPEVVATRDQLKQLWADHSIDRFDFWSRFCELIGEPPWPRRPLPPQLDDGVRALMHSRGPWEARPDWTTLRSAQFPKLVISGGHHAGFEEIADTIARRTVAERCTLPGRRHMVPQVGNPFNGLAEDFWQRADSALSNKG
nr:alpha/beta hydrolase [Flexivirga oryzae]